MKLKYIGDGSAFPDIPARDLNEEECEKVNTEMLINSGLYVEIKPEKKQKPATKQAEE